ncbi:hypothetical protein IWX75_003483 [Arthrobacter sp. CAN_A6]
MKHPATASWRNGRASVWDSNTALAADLATLADQIIELA